MFIEKRESRFTFDPGRGHTSYQSIVFYKHANPPGFGSYQLCFAQSPSRHNQQAEGPAYPSPMATSWETMKQQPMASPWDNRQNCGVRHRL